MKFDRKLESESTLSNRTANSLTTAPQKDVLQQCHSPAFCHLEKRHETGFVRRRSWTGRGCSRGIQCSRPKNTTGFLLNRTDASVRKKVKLCRRWKLFREASVTPRHTTSSRKLSSYRRRRASQAILVKKWTWSSGESLIVCAAGASQNPPALGIRAALTITDPACLHWNLWFFVVVI